tara:strand:+ start:92 stop:226 length:135 start_codon:yes stop_codon:yes gene_type:complete
VAVETTSTLVDTVEDMVAEVQEDIETLTLQKVLEEETLLSQLLN